MGYFQVESFPEFDSMIGRTVFTEIPVTPRVAAPSEQAAAPPQREAAR